MPIRKNDFEFRADLDKFAQVTRTNIDEVVRVTALTIFTKIVRRTPVRTGRARGSWAISIGERGSWLGLPKEYKGGAGEAEARAMSEVKKLNARKGDARFFIFNNLPYIERLEFGWSKQAPHGMVRIALAEVETEINGVIRRVIRG